MFSKKSLIFIVFLIFNTALAHWSDLSAAEIVLEANQMQMNLTFPTRLAEKFDTDKSGVLSKDEIKAQNVALRRFFAEKIKVFSGAENSLPMLEAADTNKNFGPKANTHSTVLLTYALPNGAADFRINYNLFVDGVSTASCVATLLYEQKAQEIVFRPNATEFKLESAVPSTSFFSFVQLGIEHILTGYDHLLFVLSLLMLGGGLAYLLKVITAFTVAHSITLSLAALNIIHLPSQLVESGIALTIAFVAAENLFRKDVTVLSRSRWLLTFGFGLFHGLGFAGVLKEIGLPKDNELLSLLGFNVGVELGQLAVVIPAFLLLQAAKKIPWEQKARQAVSLFAVAAGLFWFVERAFL
jgi:hypothetical protein